MAGWHAIIPLPYEAAAASEQRRAALECLGLTKDQIDGFIDVVKRKAVASPRPYLEILNEEYRKALGQLVDVPTSMLADWRYS